jgi:hypothetical protein
MTTCMKERIKKPLIVNFGYNILLSGIFICLSCLITISCSSSRLSVIPQKTIEEYPYFQEKNGLRIGIDPYTSPDRVKKFFSYNLLSENTLPILVKIENNVKDTSYYISGKSIRTFNDPALIAEIRKEFSEYEFALNNLEMAYLNDVGRFTEAKVNYSLKRYNNVLLWGDVFYAVVGIPLLIGYLTQEAKSHGIEYNLTKSTLMEKTLNPGTDNNGFVFCRLNNSQNDFVLVVEAIDYKNKKSKYFYFPVIWSKIKK